MNEKLKYLRPEIEVIEITLEEVVAGIDSGCDNDMDICPPDPGANSSKKSFWRSSNPIDFYCFLIYMHLIINKLQNNKNK